MTKLLKAYLANRDGSFGVIGAVTMLLLIITIGVSMDLSRITQLSSTLKSATDMAALAATKDPGLTVAEREVIFQDYMEQSLANVSGLHDLKFDLKVVETEFTRTIDVTARTDASLYFYKTRSNTTQVHARSEVQVGKEAVEVALVLDISSSMNGQRITQLQQAAKSFVSTLLEKKQLEERVTISIVPYGGTVRLPDQLETMLIPPSTTEDWVDEEWNGCVNLLPSDIQTPLTPGGTYGYLPEFYVWNKNNPWCPKAGNELEGLSDDKQKLQDKIDSFTLSDGTGSDMGVVWGYATLNPAWRGALNGIDAELPRDYSESTKKIMVVMTDGGITTQYFPTDSQRSGDLPYSTKKKSTTFNESLGVFNTQCDSAKSNGIEIYTVGFLMTKTNQINRLRACASSTGNHFEADLGSLQATFENLANSISSLRLSK